MNHSSTEIPGARALCTFVPRWLLRSLADEPLRPRAGAYSEAPAAALIADISGFSRLADRLAAQGPAGAEQLALILDACFSGLIRTIEAHGGDVLRFAGDALLVAFRAADDAGIGRAIEAAASCAVSAHRSIDPRLAEEPLRLRVGIAAGQVYLWDVGGVDERWEFLAAGLPLLEMAEAERAAKPGETVLTSACARYLTSRAKFEQAGAGLLRLVHMEAAWPAFASGEALLPTARVRPYLAPSLVRRLDAGHADWLAEFREVTVLLVNLPDIAFRSGIRMAEFQQVFCSIQSAIFAQDGDATQVVVDDKGLVIVAPFGMPLHAHEDDAVRAVQVARGIAQALAATTVSFRIGVATGRVFCGTYGPEHRREAVIVGTAVNRASRLADATDRGILCDGETARRSSHRVHYTALEPIAIKGTELPVAVFRPEAELFPPIAASSTRMVAREDEQRDIDAILFALHGQHEGGLLFLEGEAGVGKSVLLQHVLNGATNFGITHCHGVAQAVSGASAYGPWRRIFSQLLGLDELKDIEARTERVLERVHAFTERVAWAALLNPVLPVAIPESEAVREMAFALRGPNTRELLLDVLAGLAQQQPMVVVLDDAHWLDASSWDFVRAVHQSLAHLLLVIAARPMPEPPEVCRELRHASNAKVILLGRMDAQGVEAVVCRHLQVDRLPPEVARLIAARAEGHPLFAVELAAALRDARLITLRGGSCVINREVTALETVALPSTVQGILTSRFDRLLPAQQLIVKVASVLGRGFTLSLFSAIHPVASDRPQLREHFETLIARELLAAERTGGELVYAFRHILIQEAAYNLLPYGQRRDLHCAAARYLEGSVDATMWPIVGDHWARGGNNLRARLYFDRAGEAALKAGANREALDLLRRSQAIDDAGDDDITKIRRALWMADASLGSGDVVASEAFYHRTLAMLGSPLPRGQIARSWALAREAVRQIWHLILPPRPRAKVVSIRHGLRAQAASGAAENSYYNLDMSAFLYLSLLTTNEAEMADRSLTVVVSGYTVLGYMTAFAGLRRLSRQYFERAKRTPDTSTLAHAESSQGSVLFLTSGGGTEHIVRGYLRAREVRDRRVMGMCLEIARIIAELRNPGLAAKLARAGLAVAQGYNTHHTLWHQHGLAASLLREGQAQPALDLLQTVDITAVAAEPGLQARHACLVGSAHTHLGPYSQALAAVSAAGSQLATSYNPAALASLWHHFHACLSLLDSSSKPDDRAQIQALVRQAAASLRGFARNFPVAASRAYEARAILAMRSNQLGRARKWLEQAVGAAQSYGLCAEEARLRRQLAPLLSAPRAEQELSAAQACEQLLVTGTDPLQRLIDEN